MNYEKLCKLIEEEARKDSSFLKSTAVIQENIFSLNRKEVVELLLQIGSIPEHIEHDSSEEKLYAKTADILLAKSFRELGLSSEVVASRANCADVTAKSAIHNYSLVGDAKAFRLSRTPKNQKDFKVKSMADWRDDHDYSVLVCPYYQYPKSTSQIYGQALDGNVCLISWEHLALFLREEIRETNSTNLSAIWNVSSRMAESLTIKEKNNNFCQKENETICEFLKIEPAAFEKVLLKSKKKLKDRSEKEIKYWRIEIENIKKYTRKKAVNELIAALKINEKILSIEKFISSLDA